MRVYNRPNKNRYRHIKDISRQENDILIFGRLEIVSLDSEGDLMIGVSKHNKVYLSYVLKLLKEHIGEDISISIRTKRSLL